MLSRTFDDPNDAGAWVQETKARLRRGDAVELPSIVPALTGIPATTVEAAAQHFFRSMVAGTARGQRGQEYAAGTIVAYESAFRTCFLDEIGDLPLEAVSRRELRQLIDRLASITAPHPLHTAMAALKAIYTLADRDGLWDGSNPCDGIVNHAPEVTRRGRALRREEQVRLIEAAAEHDRTRGYSLMLPLVRLLLSTGLRVGEALGLRYDPAKGLDLERAVLHVHYTVGMGLTDGLKRRPRLMLRERTKTPSSRATVRLGRSTVEALQSHREVTGAVDGGLVFSDPSGTILYPSRWPLAQAWADTKRRSGLEPPNLRIHDLRHTFGSTLIEMGERLPAVAQRMRHKTPEVTARIYAHELGDDQDGNRYDDWLAGVRLA